MSKGPTAPLPDGYHGWIPAVASYPGCGALTPYMFGAAIAHSQVFNVIAHHGQSGGAITAALAASRAPIETVVRMCEAWDPTQSLRQTNIKGWRGLIDLQGRGNIDALEAFLHEQLIELGHETWGSFRYDERPEGIEFDHRLQVGLCYIDVPEKRVSDFIQNQPTFLRSMITARSPRIKHMVFPRDAHLLLPHLMDGLDNLPVAEWLGHTSRHPSQFKPKGIRLPSGGLRVIFDGAISCPQPYLFPSNDKPPFAQVTFRHTPVKDSVRQYAADLHDHPWTLINRGEAPCGSFDINGVLAIKNDLVQLGHADCVQSMNETLLSYLECMEEGGNLRERPVPVGSGIPLATPLARAAARRLSTVSERAQQLVSPSQLRARLTRTAAEAPTRVAIPALDGSAAPSLGLTLEVG